MGGLNIQINSTDLEKAPRHEKRDEAPIIPQSTYYDRIILQKLQHRPWLESLHQFMDPNAKGFAMNLAKRMNHFDIKVVHISPSGKPDSAIRCSTPEDFDDVMTEDKERIGTLVIAKGLSRAMIEILGSTFALEPEFFASQLVGTELFRMGHQVPLTEQPPARVLYLMADYIRKYPFYTADYNRPYHIKGGREVMSNMRVTETTTPRGVKVIHDDLPDNFYGEKISVYKKRGSKIGIILTDELLSSIPSASHVWNPVTALDDNREDVKRWQQVSSRQELVSWLQGLEPDQAKTLFNDHDQLALSPILKLVESNGAMFLSYTRHMMNRILAQHCDAQFPNSIPFFLKVCRNLHRYIHQQKMLLRYALRLVSLRGSANHTDQIQDFQFLMEELDATLKALEEDVRFLLGEASIREGRIVGWVSKFAALFLPVSLLATILSISDPGFARWAILGGLSVPFVLISIYFMFFWKPAYFDSLRSWS